MALSLTAWTERWIPDAFVFALLGTVVVAASALLATPSTLPQIVDAWGRGFWDLIPFTLQMALIIITGHVLATSGPMQRLIGLIAGWPSTPRGAVALVTLFALVSSWFNWGFSLVFSAVLAREVARRVDGVDYRALAAASFLGLGSIGPGRSGSAALQMATAGALQPRSGPSSPTTAWCREPSPSATRSSFGKVSCPSSRSSSTAVMWLATPPPGRARTAASLGIDLGEYDSEPFRAPQNVAPGAWLEHSSIVTLPIVAMAAAFLARYFLVSEDPLSAFNVNILNLTFLMLGFMLHRTPARLMLAVRAATPAVWGVLLQFPFYAGIAGMITATHLNEQLAGAFGRVATRDVPAIVATYSAVLRVFRALRRIEMGDRSSVRHGGSASLQVIWVGGAL
jgi:short-chain fatty acids transporter